MLMLFAVFGIIFLILTAAEALYRLKILKGEQHRKFIHIATGCFIASWPWLMSWKTIQLLGLTMLAVVFINQYHPIWHFTKSVKRETYGDVLFAVAVVACATLTSNNVFFAIAILHLALADGFAAIAGQQAGRSWEYKVFHQTKTIIGSMTFWFLSFCILAVGLLFAHNQIEPTTYVALIILLPPILTMIENLGGLGTDNIVVPLVVLLVLSLASS